MAPLSHTQIIASLINPRSHKYVKKILSKLPPGNLHLSTAIKSVRNAPSTAGQKSKVLLITQHGDEIIYDHVILACHSDTSLAILRAGDITPDEERILSMFDWNHNEAILHSDDKVRSSDSRRRSRIGLTRHRLRTADAEESQRVVVLELSFLHKGRPGAQRKPPRPLGQRLG